MNDERPPIGGLVSTRQVAQMPKFPDIGCDGECGLVMDSIKKALAESLGVHADEHTMTSLLDLMLAQHSVIAHLEKRVRDAAAYGW